MDDIYKRRKLPNFIQGDDLSLKISSYPVFLEYLAERIGEKTTLIELCCGVGIGLIYLSKCFNKLYGIDIDDKVLGFAKTNIQNAKLETKVELIKQDVTKLEILSKYKPEVVIYDIPYWSDHNNDLLKKNPDFTLLIESIKKHLTNNIIVYSPINLDYEYYSKLIGNDFELEEIYINDRHDRNVLYLGELLKVKGPTKKTLYT